jgi:uncharacterized protein (DUF2141 family)
MPFIFANIKVFMFFIFNNFIQLLLPLFIHLNNPAPQEELKIDIANIRNNKGYILISLFKDGTGYPDQADKAFRKAKVVITEKKAFVVFNDIPAGNYAVSVLHDENGDQVLNKNKLGLPKEGYGFSNNVAGAFGPPSYYRARFKYEKKNQHKMLIRLRY